MSDVKTDKPGKNGKLGLQKKYRLMTRDLGWDTTYQPREKVFPFEEHGGGSRSTTGTPSKIPSA